MIMNVALIPVRGGSKSIPLKNIKLICGKPLVYWTAKAACNCSSIDKVYIATDSKEIRETIDKFVIFEKDIFAKLEVISRSEENASDTASTEAVMLEFARKYDFTNIALIQATSPLLSEDDLDGGFNLFNLEDTDSVLSVVRQKRFLWNVDIDGYANPSNYDVYNRPRRQEFEGFLMENGAFYISTKERLISSGNRVSGKIRAYEMPDDTALEIDEPSDFEIIERLLLNRVRHLREKEHKKIKMFITDCDGCLTDGGMYYSENGDELKKFNTKDGMAISALKKQGIITGIITGEKKALNRRRAEKLHMDFIEEGVIDKGVALKHVCDRFGVMPEEVIYVGDDINDIEAMECVGISACPNDATEEVKKVANYVAVRCGGHGAIREIIQNCLPITV